MIGSKQASEYSINTNFIINHIRKEFVHRDDIAGAMESGLEWAERLHRPLAPLPTKKTSLKTPAKAKAE